MANDKLILDTVLEQKRKELAPTRPPNEFFELFVAEQILKKYDLSYDELEGGVVGGSNDGGVDAIYTFVNGTLLEDDSDTSLLRKDIVIELYIIQANTPAGYSEDAIDKLTAFSEDAFDLQKDTKKLSSTYNSQLLNRIERFRSAYLGLASKFPKLAVTFYYASKGDKPHPNVTRKVERLKQAVKKQVAAAEVTFHFLGAANLLQLGRQQPPTTYTLPLRENPISTSGEASYVALVKLEEFVRFISDEKGQLRKAIFEANVRDYQGDTQVNEAIQAELGSKHAEDFWWLNNGITILASKATESGKRLVLESPEIVNGLQTSKEIHRFFTEAKPTQEGRNILIRVIVPNDPASRDRIIKATNSQNYMPISSLHATEKMHRDIEDYLRPNGLYYDRRKNYYKNQGKPIDKIIGIPQLAQAVISIVLGNPNDARARPSSAFTSEDYYKRVFNPEYPPKVYLVCAQLARQVHDFLKRKVPSHSERYNLRFHLATYASFLLTQTTSPNVRDIEQIDLNQLDDGLMCRALSRAKSIYKRLGATDQVAKGPEFVAELKEDAKKLLTLKKKPYKQAGKVAARR